MDLERMGRTDLIAYICELEKGTAEAHVRTLTVWDHVHKAREQRDAYLENLTNVQTRCTELLEEARALKHPTSKLEAERNQAREERDNWFARYNALNEERRLVENARDAALVELDEEKTTCQEWREAGHRLERELEAFKARDDGYTEHALERALDDARLLREELAEEKAGLEAFKNRTTTDIECKLVNQQTELIRVTGERDKALRDLEWMRRDFRSDHERLSDRIDEANNERISKHNEFVAVRAELQLTKEQDAASLKSLTEERNRLVDEFEAFKNRDLEERAKAAADAFYKSRPDEYRWECSIAKEMWRNVARAAAHQPERVVVNIARDEKAIDAYAKAVDAALRDTVVDSGSEAVSAVIDAILTYPPNIEAMRTIDGVATTPGGVYRVKIGTWSK